MYDLSRFVRLTVKSFVVILLCCLYRPATFDSVLKVSLVLVCVVIVKSAQIIWLPLAAFLASRSRESVC